MILRTESPTLYALALLRFSVVRERSASDESNTYATSGPGQMPRATGPRGPLFPLGRVLATPGALHALAVAEVHRGHGARRAGADAPASDSLVASLLARHVSGDWGQLDAEDQAANEQALAYGTRILSAYDLATGERVWIITEADRSATTLLLPSEY